MYEMRVRPKDLTLIGYEWEIVGISKEGGTNPFATHTSKVIQRGESASMAVAIEKATRAFEEAVHSSVTPARHLFDCPCGAQLVIEARRSRQSPYTWDSPREITCGCQRSYGVKLHFTTGRADPQISALPRS
jgi:hypothetical protein